MTQPIGLRCKEVNVGRRLDSQQAKRLQRIYRDHLYLVRAAVQSRGVPDAAVDDVVHDVFLSVYRRLPQRDESVPLRRWLIGVSRNVAFAHRRAAARRVRRQHKACVATSEAPLDVEYLDARRAWDIVSRFLKTLPCEQRDVFMLCALHGLAATEVATALHCSPNTVGSRLRLARAKFARRFPDARGVGDTTALLDAARRGSHPDDPVERQRALAVLIAELGLAPSGTAPIAVSISPWVWAASSAAAVALTVGTLAGSSPPSDTRAEQTTMHGSDSVSATPTSMLGASEAVTSPAPAGPQDPPTAPATIRPQLARAAANMPASTPGRGNAEATPSAQQASTADVAAKAPKPPKASSLVRQTRMLRDARRAVAEHRLSQAAGLIAEHAGLFPEGELRNERLRVDLALQCALGHDLDAADLLQRLEGIVPVRGACNKP